MATAQNAIAFTFNEETHEYRDANGVLVPSATQCLEAVGLVHYDGVPEYILERKSDLGTKVHAACNYIMTPEQGELDWETLDPLVTPYVLGFESFVEEMRFVPKYVEHGGVTITSAGRIGFRCDLLGILNDKIPTIVEIKCAYSEQKSWKWQLAIYDMGYLALGIKPQDLVPAYKYPNFARMAVQLKPDGTYKPYHYENRKDRDIAQWAVALTTVQVNEGLWPKKEK